MPRRRSTQRGRFVQMTLPLFLSSATTDAPFPPGLTINRLPSISGDSLMPHQMLPSAEAIEQLGVPDPLAIGGSQADEVAVGGDCVDTVTVDRGRSARPAAPALVERAAIGHFPELLAGFLIEGDDILRAVPLALREKPPPGDRERSKTFPQPARFPSQRRATRRPCFEQSGFRGNAVASGSPPLRPVAQGRRCREQDQEQVNSGGSHIEVSIPVVSGPDSEPRP